MSYLRLVVDDESRREAVPGVESAIHEKLLT
jgi:hypothetical protein